MIYGCIGEHLGHSFSKEIHNRIDNYPYEIREIPRDELDSFMKSKDFVAINVTIPYKQAVIPYLDYIHPAAEEINAVNTIVNKDGKLLGYNTDFAGMSRLSERIGIHFQGKKVLILGTGGTSKTAVAVAKTKNASAIFTVSRQEKEGSITYTQATEQHSDAEIIINTTPCGMYPDNEGVPIDIDKFPKLEAVLDAVYNPLRTPLIQKALSKGFRAEGGLYMLVSQAVAAAERFTGKEYSKDITDKIYTSLLAQKENIVLTGMPGSGKSTVGRLLAQQTGRELIDTDEIIEKDTGMKISQIFEQYGEEAFRDMETAAVKEASAKNNCIIATGGGAVLRAENINALKSNGRIYFIDRPLEKLIPTEDRPLARDAEAITQRYNERYGIYCNTADAQIDGANTPEQVMLAVKGEHGI
jgi:shikimate dehydrogenase